MLNKLIESRQKMLNNKKRGFTLVELIVVLVILAILLAILVPGLTKWIDKAKEKQILINARTAYLACQTVASEIYGGVYDSTVAVDADKKFNSVAISKAKELANVSGTISEVTIDDIKNYKVTGMKYTEGGKTATLSGSAWKVE